MRSKRNKPLVFTDQKAEENATVAPGATAADAAAAAEPPTEPDLTLGPADSLIAPAAQAVAEPAAPSVREPSAEHMAAMKALYAREAKKRPVVRKPKAAKAERISSDGMGVSWWVYPAAIAAGVAWSGGLVAFVLGFQTRFGVFSYDMLQWVVIAVLGALPAAFLLLGAFALRQGSRLSAETRRARQLADDLAIPAALAADQTGGAMEAMRREINRASEAAIQAQAPIAALRDALAEESRKMVEAAAQAQQTSRVLSETLGRERIALSELAGALQAQAAEAADSLEMQSRVVGNASDLAQAQLQEAQAALAARAADLAIAAGEASDAAVAAGVQLSQQVERLETVGESLSARLSRLQLSITAERENLGHMTQSLRADHEDLAVAMDRRRGQLNQAVTEALEGAGAIGDASESGAEALRALIATAAEEVRRLAEAAQREQAEMDAKARDAVGLLSEVAHHERASLEAQNRAAIEQLAAAADEARYAATRHMEMATRSIVEQADLAQAKMDILADAAAARMDGLGEAAFAANQKADELFESRVTAARRLIEQSVALVDESGERSAQRIEAGLSSAKASMQDLQSLFAEVDARFDRLPEEARARAEAIRDAVEQGVGDLTAAARRAAEETQAIDAAFQERVRRNYEVLSEAVLLMGRVAGAAGAPAAPVAAEPPRTASPIQTPITPRTEPQTAERPVEVRPAMAVGGGGIRVAAETPPPAIDPLRPAALSETRRPDPTPASAGLRPRLRLTPADEALFAAPAEAFQAPEPPEPTEPEPRALEAHTPEPRLEDEAPRSLLGEPPVRVPPAEEEDDEWTWKDLLTSMDEPVDDETLAEKLMSEITSLGVETGVLLPRARVDEIAAVLQMGDSAGARAVVRRLAPAAVRRLSRRVLTDKVLRSEAHRYVRRYDSMLRDAASRDREGYMTATLLGSEPGRAFLLLDAAIGDLT